MTTFPLKLLPRQCPLCGNRTITILGTLQYMAPEQLEGAEADSRTDIFALGAMIYEMATGRKAFAGKSLASLISAIMTAEPTPLLTLQATAPPALDHVVRTCLAKEPEARWQTAHDVLVELKWIAAAGSQAGSPGPLATRRKSREALAWALVTVVSLVAAVVSAIHFREKPADVHPVRFLVQTAHYLNPGVSDLPVVAPNGLRLVFPATNADGRNLLWLRSLDSPAIPIAGTEDGALPFWSPDSRFIAFFFAR